MSKYSLCRYLPYTHTILKNPHFETLLVSSILDKGSSPNFTESGRQTWDEQDVECPCLPDRLSSWEDMGRGNWEPMKTSCVPWVGAMGLEVSTGFAVYSGGSNCLPHGVDKVRDT